MIKINYPGESIAYKEFTANSIHLCEQKYCGLCMTGHKNSTHNEEKMRNQRSVERFDLELPATIEFMHVDHKEMVDNLLTKNVCSGGAYFYTSQPLPKGTQVKIDLVLPLEKLRKLKDEHKQAYIKVTGKVLRSESEGMAICFDEDYQITGSTK